MYLTSEDDKRGVDVNSISFEVKKNAGRILKSAVSLDIEKFNSISCFLYELNSEK